MSTDWEPRECYTETVEKVRSSVEFGEFSSDHDRFSLSLWDQEDERVFVSTDKAMDLGNQALALDDAGSGPSPIRWVQKATGSKKRLFKKVLAALETEKDLTKDHHLNYGWKLFALAELADFEHLFLVVCDGLNRANKKAGICSSFAECLLNHRDNLFGAVKWWGYAAWCLPPQEWHSSPVFAWLSVIAHEVGLGDLSSALSHRTQVRFTPRGAKPIQIACTRLNTQEKTAIRELFGKVNPAIKYRKRQSL